MTPNIQISLGCIIIGVCAIVGFVGGLIKIGDVPYGDMLYRSNYL